MSASAHHNFNSHSSQEKLIRIEQLNNDTVGPMLYPTNNELSENQHIMCTSYINESLDRSQQSIRQNTTPATGKPPLKNRRNRDSSSNRLASKSPKQESLQGSLSSAPYGNVN